MMMADGSEINGGGDAAMHVVEEEEKPLRFPPGYRFNPRDQELVVHYLQNKLEHRPLPCNIVKDVLLYHHDPNELVETYRQWGEEKWYFFTPRDRKYLNGRRPKRAAGSGYWKATGIEKPIYSGNKQVGIKRALVFHRGKPGEGTMTDWVMHEYEPKVEGTQHHKPDGTMKLDEWVLCSIQKKRRAKKDDSKTKLKATDNSKTTRKVRQETTNKTKKQRQSHEVQNPREKELLELNHRVVCNNKGKNTEVIDGLACSTNVMNPNVPGTEFENMEGVLQTYNGSLSCQNFQPGFSNSTLLGHNNFAYDSELMSVPGDGAMNSLPIYDQHNEQGPFGASDFIGGDTNAYSGLEVPLHDCQTVDVHGSYGLASTTVAPHFSLPTNYELMQASTLLPPTNHSLHDHHIGQAPSSSLPPPPINYSLPPAISSWPSFSSDI